MKATFAAGCFWQVEEVFRHLKGVTSTTVGYTGGDAISPSYELVCAGNTGHAEAVEVEYNPEEISYKELLNTFWQCHDPTTPNRQGADIGNQYRSAIFYHNDMQKDEADMSKENLESAGSFKSKIVTEISPAGDFNKAEDYHQQYLEKRGLSTCKI